MRARAPVLALALLLAASGCTTTPREPTYLLLANGTPHHLAIAAIVNDRAWPLGLLPAGDSAMVPLPTELLVRGDSLHLGLIPLGGRPERMPPHWIQRGKTNRIEFAPKRSAWRGV